MADRQKILIVDDSELNREILKDMIVYRVRLAVSSVGTDCFKR